MTDDPREKWNDAERAAWINGASTAEVEARALVRIRGEEPQAPTYAELAVLWSKERHRNRVLEAELYAARIQGEAP